MNTPVLPALSPSTFHVLRVVVADIEPKVWRKLSVASDLSLAELHEVLQLAFGWSNEFYHQFILPDKRAKPHGEIYVADPVLGLGEGKNSHEFVLAEVCPRVGSQLLYHYDMEDDWMHEIEVVAITPAVKAGANAAACSDGARNGPMESCGGPGGHMELVDALANPADADPKMLEWGEGYDPELLDLEAINGLLLEWSQERKAQLAKGARWRRSGLLWDLENFPKEFLAPKG